MSFEDDMKRLQAIAEKLRSNDTPLDESVSLFEEGVNLTKTLDEGLSKVERKVEILLSGADDHTQVETADFDGATDGND